LLSGFALAALGLATQPAQPGQSGPNEPPPVANPGDGTGFTFAPGYGTADSNDAMIAVTGIDVTGASILYVIDTQHRQLAVYQANGGSSSMMGLTFVAGRNIDLDLQVWGYNDKSEHSFREMQEEFKKEGR
jgi:hypothetical protein